MSNLAAFPMTRIGFRY